MTRTPGWRTSTGAEAAGLGEGAERQGRSRDRLDARSSSSWKARSCAILDSDAKIPGVEKIGDHYYNFWKDKNHERGLWRRTTLEEYRKPQPQWETVLDLDALKRKAEDENWVWHGADCLQAGLQALPDRAVARRRRCRRHPRVRPGHQALVKDGFFRPEAKGALGWIDADTVYVFTDFGAGQHDHLRLSAHRQGMEARHAAGAGHAWCTKASRRHVHRRLPRRHAGLRARLRQPHHRLLQRRAVPARQRRQAGQGRRAQFRQQGRAHATG